MFAAAFTPEGIVMKYVLALLIFCLSHIAVAQGVAALENRFSNLQQQIESGKARLDSLDVRLEKQASQIDAEKKKETVDKEKVRRLMSESIPLTAQIDEQQKQLNNLQKEREQLKYLLAQRYSAKLDSLQSLGKSRDSNPEELQKQIVFYTEKYLAVSPAFRALSFDPEKIRQINISSTNDSLEQAIARDYLQKAQTDIANHLADIEQNRKELEATLRLERKTREFLEEVDDENFALLSRAGNPGGAKELSLGNAPTGAVTDELSLSVATRVESMALFFEQLNISNSEELIAAWQYAVQSGETYLTLEEYLTLLKTAEKQLRQFHSIIENKLKGQ